ncbi:MAG: metallophosphoesterase [Bacteroidales bacterium]|nr:metallophosphoesterase [Bacteroidales bacterium]
MSKLNFTFQFNGLLALSGIFFLITASGCQKENQEYNPQPVLTVTMAGYDLKHDLYYQIPYTVRSVELLFSEALDTGTVAANLSLSDQEGSCDGNITVLASGHHAILLFHPDFALHDGWQYWITIRKGLHTLSGTSFSSDVTLQLRTFQKHPDLTGDSRGDSVTRESILVISDVHMGDARSIVNKYGWFGENGPALVSLLDGVLGGDEVRQVVILGDLLDEWIVPFSMPPFDSATGITNSMDYFQSVANNPVNLPVIEKLRAIAASGEIELIFVPGNHDMLINKEIIQGIIPGITWKSDTIGLGRYFPVPEIVMEHGHRYDFFNCPQPLINQGHILPPGYFISRLYAQGNMEHPGMLKSTRGTQGSFEFDAAWDIAIAYTLFRFGMWPPDFWANNIRMSGINDYTQLFSFHGAKEMYNPLIESEWPMTQTANNVLVPINECIIAIWNGHSDLFSAAQTEYMKSPAPVTCKIVAFGHTHEPMIEVYPTGSQYTSIYANTGSWVDGAQSTHDVRTYLLITPGAWSGSTLDVVSLFQFNPTTQGGFKPKLLGEESIESDR